MRKGQGDQSEFGEQSKDHTDMAHAAVKIGTGIIVLLGFLVLMIMMTHMRGHRIMLVLAIRTHRRCSCLQGQHGDQQKTEEGSHAAEFTSFAKHDHSGFTRTAMKKSCDVGQIDTPSNRKSRWPTRSHDARAILLRSRTTQSSLRTNFDDPPTRQPAKLAFLGSDPNSGTIERTPIRPKGGQTYTVFLYSIIWPGWSTTATAILTKELLKWEQI